MWNIIIVAICLVLTGFLIGGLYSTATISGDEGHVAVVNRFTGAVTVCSVTGVCADRPYKKLD
jgi:hypothetical protein